MTVSRTPGPSGHSPMYSTVRRPRTEKERILYWEWCLMSRWGIPEPPEGWKEALKARDAAGVTKYG